MCGLLLLRCGALVVEAVIKNPIKCQHECQKPETNSEQEQRKVLVKVLALVTWPLNFALRANAPKHTPNERKGGMIHQKQAECVCFWFLDWVFYHSANLETLPAPGDELVEESGI
jgi:hypothetical protein